MRGVEKVYQHSISPNYKNIFIEKTIHLIKGQKIQMNPHKGKHQYEFSVKKKNIILIQKKTNLFIQQLNQIKSKKK
jgi:hypothetical protein